MIGTLQIGRPALVSSVVAAGRIPITGLSIRMYRSHQSDFRHSAKAEAGLCASPPAAAVPRAGVQGEAIGGEFHFLLISLDSRRMTFIPPLPSSIVGEAFFPTFKDFHKGS